MTLALRLMVAVLCLGMVVAVPGYGQQSSRADAASIPHLIQFSGTLKDADGKPVHGTVGITFALYKEETGGVPLWMETQSVKVDAAGHYSVMLGQTTSQGLPTELFVANEAHWLGIEPQDAPALARVLLLSVPYALKAGDAETIGGLPPSAFVLAAPARAASSSTSSAAATPVPPPASSVTTAGGTVNAIPLWSTATDIENSVLTQSGTGTTARIGINTTTPTSTLDVKGAATLRGNVALPATGAATSTAGKNSQPQTFTASSFSSGTSTAVNQSFRWQAEPAGNNTANASGTLNLLFAHGTAAPAETGLKVGSNGQITFAAGQTFPGTGNGTITGVTAGTDLTGGGTNGNITLALDTTKVPQLNSTNTFTANQTVNGTVTATSFSGNGSSLTSLQGGNVQGNVGTANNALSLGGLPPSSYQLAGSYATLGANTFTGKQTVNGDVTSTGNVTGAIVNATSYSIAGSLDPFLSGSEQNNNAFLGFAGNSTTTGINNIAAGPSALFANTSGGWNAAVGSTALTKNTTGASNSALGTGALGNNTTGGSNTAVGGVALTSNQTGSYNTGLGYGAGPDASSPGLTNATAIGAFAVVSKSNALVLGGTGANAVNVGIGTATPNSTLDVHGTGNFTGLITFASGQTFPGAGTITGVTAGTGLSGGGTSGTVPVSLNTTYTDGRYAQLAANNTFSGVQTINNSVGIGTVPNPVFALQAIGKIRSETGGLSLGGFAPVSVDANGVAGGRFTILSNGNVGINNPAPTTNLDVNGNIDARGTLIGQNLSVAGSGVINGGLTTSAGVTVGGALIAQGSLTIKNDTPMNAAPHMFFGGFFAGAIAQGQYGGKIRPTKDILITYMSVIGGQQQIADCNPAGTISLVNQNTLANMYSLVLNSGLNAETSSGPISIPVTAGTGVYLQVTTQPGCGIYTGPNNIQANVEYVMQ